MGNLYSKNDAGGSFKGLYEPIQVYSPMTKFHALAVTMSDGGLVDITGTEYQKSKQYLDKKGVNIYD